MIVIEIGKSRPSNIGTKSMLFSYLLCNSCHIRHLMKCPNWCRTWNICFLLIFSWKMLQPNFAFWDIFMLLRCLNSKEIKLQSSIRVICIIFDLIFFSWKLKIKQMFQVRQLFQRFFKRRIWHEKHKSGRKEKIRVRGRYCFLSNISARFRYLCSRGQ